MTLAHVPPLRILADAPSFGGAYWQSAEATIDVHVDVDAQTVTLRAEADGSVFATHVLSEADVRTLRETLAQASTPASVAGLRLQRRTVLSIGDDSAGGPSVPDLPTDELAEWLTFASGAQRWEFGERWER